MNSDKLELPKGLKHAFHIDGMREVKVYDIRRSADEYRWDTIIGEKQHTVRRWLRENTSDIGSWEKEMRADARKYFEGIENAANEVKA